MNNKTSILYKFKHACVEKAWFILLLLPIFIIFVMVLQSALPSKTKQVSSSLAAVVGSVEISAVELAAIVAKPLTELLAMEVYFESGRLASLAHVKQEFIRPTINQLSEITRANTQSVRFVSFDFAKRKLSVSRESS